MLSTALLYIFSVAFFIYFVPFWYNFFRVDKEFRRYTFPGLPIFRNVFLINRPEKLLANCLEIQKKFGNFVKIDVFCFLGGLMVSDLKMVEFLLGTTSVLNKGLPYLFLKRWLGAGLLTSSSDKWKKSRKALTPAFHFQILDQYVETLQPAGAILVKKLKSQVGKDHFNIYPYIVLCTLDIICEAAMGTKVNAQSEETNKYVKAVHEISRIVTNRGHSVWKVAELLYWFSIDYWKEKRCLKTLHDYTNSVISKRREEILRNGGQLKPKQRLAFLDLLLQSTIDGRPFTDQEIREEVNTFLFAGHDTTASAISFAMFCLSKDEVIQEKVCNELFEVFGNDKTRGGTITELNSLKYLEMVIKETLRMFPPVPFYIRSTDKDTEYYNGSLPKMTQIGIFCYGSHHDPNNFPNPEIFDPERFTPENQSARHPFSYIPFSAGPRNCIGQKFAMLEIKSTLSLILRNYVVLPAPEYELQLIALPVMKSQNGLRIKLEERA